jgi:DNA end-binding protein Ku
MALRSMWKGTVSFGLVSVPVKMFAATQDNEVKTHMVHTCESHGRISYRKVCASCETEVAYEEIGRAVETEAGMVVLSKEELTALDTASEQVIEVERFVPAEQIDPIMYNKTYYLGPDKAGAKAYVLLSQVMGGTDRVAVAKLTMRGRTHLATMRVSGDVLVVNTLHWPDEVRTPDVGLLPAEVTASEVDMAAHLVTAMTGDWEPGLYTNARREKVLDLIASRDAIPYAAPAEPTATVHDLMSALKASVLKHTAA